ncbi:MAG: RHS repeat protein, partial [Chthonomonadaceae bacterium]|nr:RHS repeat protein [Chthonomonadaceae bacterium]
MTRDQRDKHIARSLMVACAILLAETVWPGLRTAGLEVAQVAKQVEEAAQGSYSKLPTAPPPVKVPFRDERRTKIWRGNNLDALYRACAARAIDRNEVLCSIAPLPETIVTTTGGSGGGPGLTNEGSYITNRTNLLEPGGPPSGSGYEGYGSSTRFNTGTGNQTTGVSLTAWNCRGDLAIGMGLIHNSKDDNTNCGLGIGWSHSYNMALNFVVNQQQNDVTVVQMPDETKIPYKLTGTDWVPPAGFFDKLTQTSSGWKLTTKDQHEYVLTNMGTPGNAYLTAIKDRVGNTVTINRPSTGDPNQIIDVVDPDGSRKLTFNWSNNLLQSIVRSDGQTFTMEYTNGALTKVNFPNVGTYTNVYEAFTYDSNHNILTHTDRRGNTWTYTYDVNDRLATVTSPGSRPESERKTTFAYIGNEVVITLPLLDASAPTNVQTLKHTYDNGMLAQIKDAGDFTTLIS